MRYTRPDGKFKDLLTWIYFVQCKAEPSRIKIGISGGLKARFQQLNNHSPQPLKILGAIRAYDFFEVALHELFADERRHGEWFDPSPRLLRFVSKLIADHGGQQIPPVRMIERMTAANLEGSRYVMLTPWFNRAAGVLKGQGRARIATGYRKSDILFLARLGLISDKPEPTVADLLAGTSELFDTLGQRSSPA